MNLFGGPVQMNMDTQLLQPAHQNPRPGIINLPRHQSWREFHHVRVQAQIIGGLGSLQAQQSATNHSAGFGTLRIVDDVFQVLDRPVDEHPLMTDSRNGRDKRIRPGGNHDMVIRNFRTAHRTHDACITIDFAGTVTHMQLNADLFVPFHAGQHQFFGVTMRKERCQAHTVVGGTRFLAKSDDSILARFVKGDQLFAEPQAHHSVANNDDCFP